jgi:hypothetical protein
MNVHRSNHQINATARLPHKSSFIAKVVSHRTVVRVVNRTGLNLALITSKINSSSFLYSSSFSLSLLYLSINKIASFTHTHINPNIPSCAGNENGSQTIVNSKIAQINRNGITESTRKGCLKFQKCKTNTENIKIIQIPNAFNKSFIEFCISATSQAYSK